MFFAAGVLRPPLHDRLRPQQYASSMQKIWPLPGFAALVTGLLYSSGGPVWDDHLLILGLLPEIAWADLFLQPVGGGRVGSGYFRPLSMAAMKLLGSIPGIHVLSALLHAGSALLLCSLLGRDGRAVLAATVFAVHPMVSEPLAWASALPDVLSLHAGLWAVLLFHSGRQGPGAAAFVLGLLAKETACLPLLAWLLADRRPGKAWVHAGSAAAVYVLLRVFAGTEGGWQPGGAVEAASAVAWPLASTVFPYPLTAVRDLHAVPGWVLPAGLLALLSLAAAAYRGGSWSRAGFLLVLFGPLLALPPTLDGHLATERYAYPGMAGLAWALYGVLPRSSGWKAAVAISLLCLPAHALRARDWKDDQALFQAAVRALPSSSYAWHFLGYVQHGQGLYGASADSLLKAVENGHPHPMDRGLRLESLVLAGRPEEALAWAEGGPQTGLDASYIAWWGRAAWLSGREGKAKELFGLLGRDGGYDGPGWVRDWAGLPSETPDSR